MKLTKTIGFTGLAGSGKTYAATWLWKRTIASASLWSFAGNLKSVARFMGWDGEKTPKGRKLLQDLGSIGREYNRDCWVRHMPTDRPVIIDDVRYINEAAAIRSVGGIIIRVVRPGLTPIEHSSHSSETEQEHIICDYTVTNDDHFEEELQAVYDCEMGPLSMSKFTFEK